MQSTPLTYIKCIYVSESTQCCIRRRSKAAKN